MGFIYIELRKDGKFYIQDWTDDFAEWDFFRKVSFENYNDAARFIELFYLGLGEKCPSIEMIAIK